MKSISHISHMKILILASALLAFTVPVWAINKCTAPDGKVSFQDAPCAGKGETLNVRPATGHAAPSGAGIFTPPPPASLPAAPAVAAPLQTAPPPAPLPAAPVKSALTLKADECLAWYRPLLRDPAGAYHTAAAQDSRTVTFTLHATNGYGGYVTSTARCEFLNGRLDVGWTKIHAQRAGWKIER